MVLGVGKKNLKSDNYLKIFIPELLCNADRSAKGCINISSSKTVLSMNTILWRARLTPP